MRHISRHWKSIRLWTLSTCSKKLLSSVPGVKPCFLRVTEQQEAGSDGEPQEVNHRIGPAARKLLIENGLKIEDIIPTGTCLACVLEPLYSVYFGPSDMWLTTNGVL